VVPERTYIHTLFATPQRGVSVTKGIRNKGGINLNIELRRRKPRANSGWKKQNFDYTERISRILEGNTTAVSGDAGQM